MSEFIKGISFNSSNWGIARIIRLVLGLFFAISGVNEMDYFALLIGGILLYQSIGNTGCGFTRNSGSCGVDLPKTDKKVKF